MTLKIKRIDERTFDAVYPPKLANQLRGFIHSPRDWFDLSRRYWVVDPAQGTYFLQVCLSNPMDWAFSYLLIQDGEFALIRTEDHRRYTFTTISPGFALRLDEIKCLAMAALRVGGVFLDGCYNPPSGFGMDLPNINAVTQTEFIGRKGR